MFLKGHEIPFIGRESADLITAHVNYQGGASISSIKGHLFRLWAPAFPRYRKKVLKDQSQ